MAVAVAVVEHQIPPEELLERAVLAAVETVVRQLLLQLLEEMEPQIVVAVEVEDLMEALLRLVVLVAPA